MAKKVTDEQLCSALLTHSTIKDTAEFLGISERTIYSMMSTDDFKEIYGHAQADIYSNTIMICQNKMVEAINCISEIMNDKSVNPQIRLQASQTILKNTLILHEAREKLRNKAVSEKESDLFDAFDKQKEAKRL